MGEVSGGHGNAWESGNGGARRRERLLGRAFVRLVDTLADEFDIVEFLQSLSATRWRSLGPKRPA